MFKFLPIIVISTLISGCVRYVPRPIDPPLLEQSYRARGLADPNLEQFFKTNFKGGSEAWPPRSMDLEALTLLALYFSPDLDEVRTRIAASEAAIVTAGTKPNPSVLTGAGYNSERGPFAFRSDLEIPFETAGKRQYRVLRAEQLSQASRFSLSETAWRLRSRLRTALVDHLLSGRELEQRGAEAQVRREIVAIYERRLEVGETSTPFVTAARTDLSRVQLEIEQLQGRIAETRAAIAGVIGLPGTALDTVQFVLSNLEQPAAEQALNIQSVQKTGLLNRIDIRRLFAEYKAADTDLRLEIARQHPNVALAPSYSSVEGYLLGPALVLPVFDRNRGPIAEADARRETAAARLSGAQAGAIAEMERGLADYRSALRELNQAQATLDLVYQREQTAERQFKAGEVDRLALASVRLEAAAADRDRLGALRRTHTTLGALEDAVQHPLPPGTTMPEPPSTNPRDAKREPDRAKPQEKKEGAPQ